MRLCASHVLILILGLSLSACRQADGQMPAPSEIVQGELVDVAHDLQNIASARDPQAPQDLADDLGKYNIRSSAEPAVDELSRRTAAVLAGANLTEEAAQRLARNLWIAVAARELSERQVDTLQNDVQALLMAEGIPEEDAEQVAAQVGAVQDAVNDRPRRWYEMF
jgi:hypothetical protein